MSNFEPLDGVITDTVIRLSWIDWIRIAFGSPVHSWVLTDTENVVGQTRSESRAWTEVIWKHRGPAGYGEVCSGS